MVGQTKTATELLIEATLETVKNEVKDKLTEQLDDLYTSAQSRIDGLNVQVKQAEDLVKSMTEDKPLCVTTGTIEKPKKQLVHKAFMTISKILSSQKRKEKNIMLVGEAGSGKTHLCATLANAMGLNFYPMSVGLQTTKSDLLGFVNAQGGYVTTPVRKAYEEGGLLLLDEFDSAHAGVVTILNSLLANGHCSFADKIVTKHPDFVCVCACNTYGKGANMDYVGRNRLDAATLDRFITVEVGYDTSLEKSLTSHKDWHNAIKQIRKNIAKQGVKMIVSPRASMDGADLLDVGFTFDEVVDMVICKGCGADIKKAILKGVKFGSSSGE